MIDLILLWIGCGLFASFIFHIHYNSEINLNMLIGSLFFGCIGLMVVLIMVFIDKGEKIVVLLKPGENNEKA